MQIHTVNPLAHFDEHDSFFSDLRPPSLEMVPASLGERLDRLAELAYRASVTPVSAAPPDSSFEAELAKVKPELLALIQLVKHGCRGFSITDRHERTTFVRHEKRFLGLLVGETWQPETEVTITTRTFRAF